MGSQDWISRENVVRLRQVKVCFECVLRPLVTVECESISGLFLFQGFTDGIRDQRRNHIRADLQNQNDLSA